MGEKQKPLFKKGQVVRYSDGETALFKITEIQETEGKFRYYGRHCVGGSAGAWEEALSLADKEALKWWAAYKKYREE